MPLSFSAGFRRRVPFGAGRHSKPRHHHLLIDLSFDTGGLWKSCWFMFDSNKQALLEGRCYEGSLRELVRMLVVSHAPQFLASKMSAGR
jgi:hypothetical protein